MIHKSSIAFLTELDRSAISQRLHVIPVRDESRPCEAASFDPFEQEPEVRRLATEAMRVLSGSERLENRWQVGTPAAMPIMTAFGAAVPFDVSLGGIGLILPAARPIGSKIEVTFDAEGKGLHTKLAQRRIAKVEGEVRAVVPKAGGFLHGILYRQLDQRQAAFLLATLLATQGHGQGERREAG